MIKMPVVKSKVDVHTRLSKKNVAKLKAMAKKHDLPMCDVLNALIEAGVAGYEASMKKVKASARRSK